LGNEYPANRPRMIRAFHEARANLLPVLPGKRGKLGDGHAIDPGCSAIGLHPGAMPVAGFPAKGFVPIGRLKRFHARAPPAAARGLGRSASSSPARLTQSNLY